MKTSVDPCQVGDHYSCERTTCRCQCHPKHGQRPAPRPSDQDDAA